MATKAKATKQPASRREAQRKARAQLDPRVKLSALKLPGKINDKGEISEHPRGAWNPEIPERARKFALLGVTDREMAEQFGVTEVTFSRWKKSHPDLAEAVHRGREGANAEVAASLYQRAVGFTMETEDIKIVGGEPVTVKLRKTFPPEVQAQIFWLKNRRPDLWRDKVENALVGAPAGEVTPRIVVEHINAAMKEAERDVKASL